MVTESTLRSQLTFEVVAGIYNTQATIASISNIDAVISGFSASGLGDVSDTERQLNARRSLRVRLLTPFQGHVTLEMLQTIM
jgi:hypothetical protein